LSNNVLRGAINLHRLTDLLPAMSDEQRRSSSKRLPKRVVSELEALQQQATEAGYAEGFEQGRLAGMEAGRAEYDERYAALLAQFSQQLSEKVASTEAAVQAWYAEAEERLADLAIEIARRALAAELQASRESVIAIAKEAMAEVTEGTHVRLRINPADTPLLESRKAEILAALANIRDLEIVHDTHVAHGCQVETDGGMIDARIETFLARIVQEAA
jgi:flagellar assembly protein FliH